MDPVQITLALETAKAGFEFGTEVMKFLATEQGQKVVEKSLADRAEWDQRWAKFGKQIEDAFAALGHAVQQMGAAK